jgi:hypothetical protein
MTECVALESLQSRGFCMLKVPGVLHDERGQREQERRHNLHHRERRLEGERHTVLGGLLEGVLVDVLGEDTRRRSPVQSQLSVFTSSKGCKIKQRKYSKQINQDMDKRTPALL